jgi:hypothetical protein
MVRKTGGGKIICLNVYWFSIIDNAKVKIEVCRKKYNESRPHRAFRHLAPLEYVATLATRESEILGQDGPKFGDPSIMKIFSTGLGYLRGKKGHPAAQKTFQENKQNFVVKIRLSRNRNKYYLIVRT